MASQNKSYLNQVGKFLDEAFQFILAGSFVLVGLIIAIPALFYFFSLPLKTALTVSLIVELLVLLVAYSWRKKILEVIDDEIGLNYGKIVKFYEVFTLSLCIPIITFVNYLLPLSLVFNTILSLALIVVWTILLRENESLFLMLIPKSHKERVGILEINWNSPEFEKFVGKELVDLYTDTQKLIKAMRNKGNRYSDYSFTVFPLAKAYEGVLKKILVKMGFITKAQLEQDPNISINSYFNPVGNSKITKALRDKARDKMIPHVIYSTYAECRNQILHHDPYRDNRLKTIEEADFFVRRISDAINKAYTTFKKV